MKKLIATLATVLATVLANGIFLPTVAVAETFDEAFEMNRAMYGKDHSFSWTGKQYLTTHPEEVEASVEATKENAEDLIVKAKAKNAEVAKVGFEWKLTKGIIADADAAVTTGDYRKALNLAAQAKYHARIGLQQHAYAEQNWQLSVPQ
ncbi:hypothetical protein [Neptunomonas antarctica]|uniref:Uncharacterized protein n=1 Tax=Neptunomonas antarctica TaxID=619304 RepID=A0A1N7KKT8_9GAMM|nr:hypothetical protein [Neptunomonas antarctica]SIS62231.1 hypothetical protein SAMN05421760_102528 [Neptunomonas antarctica]